ncbi:hypothetical protein, partial [Hymenobacter lapidarius]|uniref:hypothetical protein n=1 Tax=Hymenobacter lapidarius TaxID=1908237 RepID=UPI00195DAAB7
MVNTYSPVYTLCAAEAQVVTISQVRYPSPPAGLRWLRWQLRILWAVAPPLAFRQAWRLFCTPRRLPLKAWEGPALALARRRTVAAESGQVAVYGVAWRNFGPCCFSIIPPWVYTACCCA